jgi:sulfate transport system permease protein
MATSFWATVFNVLFGLFASYVLSRYNFWGRNALIVTISLPTAIPTAVAGFALLLLWGPYGTLGRFLAPHGVQVMFTAGAIILRKRLRHIPTCVWCNQTSLRHMSRSLEEASATIGATRWQTFWHVTLPSLRGAIVSGALVNLLLERLVSLVRRSSFRGTSQGEPRRHHSIFSRSSTKDR